MSGEYPEPPPVDQNIYKSITDQAEKQREDNGGPRPPLSQEPLPILSKEERKMFSAELQELLFSEEQK